MTVRVIAPPAPIVTPADITGSPSPTDAGVKALIAAVTEAIDGPGGWLGRALGVQTLELALAAPPSPLTFTPFPQSPIALPYPPYVENTVSVKYLNLDNVEQTVDPANYRIFDNKVWLKMGYVFPPVADAPDAVRIRYDAGYGGDGKNGSVPERARQAIILSVQDLMRTGSGTSALRSEIVEGVGTKHFLDQDRITAVVEQTCDRLLSTLRVYVL